ncbi:MAG: PilZ domain-containing protein [Myxococcota bacterium]|nr:PilZ domain-containing protein [Myxococcota bacterium]
MPKIERKMLATIRKQLPALKELELKRCAGALSHGDFLLWMQYYNGVLRLFDAAGTKLREERQSVRIPYSAELFYKKGTDVFTSAILDVSASGVSIEHNPALEIDDVVGLTLELSSRGFLGFKQDTPVSLSAVCQWTSAQEGKTALNFLNIQDNQRVVIVNFIFEEIERQAKRAGKSG